MIFSNFINFITILSKYNFILDSGVGHWIFIDGNRSMSSKCPYLLIEEDNPLKYANCSDTKQIICERGQLITSCLYF